MMPPELIQDAYNSLDALIMLAEGISMRSPAERVMVLNQARLTLERIQPFAAETAEVNAAAACR